MSLGGLSEGVVGLAWYTPESWRELEAAIAAARLPEGTLCDSYEEFVAKTAECERGFQRQGLSVNRLVIDVPHMVAWCKRHGLKINNRGRSAYGAALQTVGGDKSKLDGHRARLRP